MSPQILRTAKGRDWSASERAEHVGWGYVPVDHVKGKCFLKGEIMTLIHIKGNRSKILFDSD